MTVLFHLVAHSLRRARVLLLATGALLAGFQCVLILVANSIQNSGSFDIIGAMTPTFLRDLMGPQFAAFLSFRGIVCVGYLHLAVIGALVAISVALATVPTSEIETGFADLILSRPVPRRAMISRSIIVCTVAPCVLLAFMLTGTWIGLNTLALKDASWPGPHLLFSLAINLVALMLCWSGIAMAIGSAARRRAVAGGVSGLLALTAFLLDYLARAWTPAEKFGWLSPFRYYSPLEMILGDPLPWKNVLILAAVAATGFALAYFFYSRRDISH
jgi:ABC-2 type transport system permease protein